MKKALHLRILKKNLMLLIVFVLLFSMSRINAQSNEYFFNDAGDTEAYLSSGFCRTLNYYWDQGLIDSQGNIYFIHVDNYKLFYYFSDDEGETWTKNQVVTAQDGNVYNAMAALTQDDSLVIIYATNPSFSNGSVSYGGEFTYDLYGAVLHNDGWEFTSLYTHSTNSGLLPYGTITVKSGMVHVVLYKYGWWNYGGELYEVMYNPVDDSWSAIETIKIFGDRNVDHSTFHVCKLAEGENDTIICVYQRHTADTKYNNLEVVMKGAGGWTEPEIILANSDYATYNRFDLDYDRHGHFYFTYFIPYGPNGPEIYMGHNTVRELTKYELFDPVDTLRKISIHPYPDAEAYIYLNFKDSLPEVLKYGEGGLVPTGWLPEFEQEDSTDVMRFHYQIPVKNNFAEKPGLFAFTNRYNGKDGNTVLSYPLVFVDANMKKDITGIDVFKNEITESPFVIYPNPGDGHILIKSKNEAMSNQYYIYNANGMLVRILDLKGGKEADISDMESGLYLIRNSDYQLGVKYLKK